MLNTTSLSTESLNNLGLICRERTITVSHFPIRRSQQTLAQYWHLATQLRSVLCPQQTIKSGQPGAALYNFVPVTAIPCPATLSDVTESGCNILGKSHRTSTGFTDRWPLTLFHLSRNIWVSYIQPALPLFLIVLFPAARSTNTPLISPDDVDNSWTCWLQTMRMNTILMTLRSSNNNSQKNLNRQNSNEVEVSVLWWCRLPP